MRKPYLFVATLVLLSAVAGCRHLCDDCPSRLSRYDAAPVVLPSPLPARPN
jgi:hypothetical protein